MRFVKPAATVARLTQPRTDEPTRLAVVADPHVTARAEGTPMVYHRSSERLRTALEDAERRGADAVISAGDLTKDGAPCEYEQLDEILAGSDLPFISVPGNHDVPKASTEVYEYGDDHETPPVERFERTYAPQEYPFVERVGGVDVLGLNTASQPDKSLQQTHDGQVSRDDAAWLETTLETVSNPVVLMHHNTPEMYDQFRVHREAGYTEMGTPPVLRNPEPLMDVLTAGNAPLVLTGHLHNIGVARTGPTWEVTAPATGSFPQGYLLVDIGPNGTQINYVPVADVKGMTEAHHARWADGPTSDGYASFAAVRLASLPLVDEHEEERTDP
ncbi:MAG: metallophosphoesterase family protein [Halodesulfurarchaeum sp.]